MAHEHYYYQEDLSTSIFNGVLQSISDETMLGESRGTFEDITLISNGELYTVKLDKYNKNFEFLREVDKKKIIIELEKKLVGMEVMIRAEQNFGNNYTGEVYITNDHTGEKNRENLADIIDSEFKKMLRSNSVKVDVELIHFDGYNSIIVRYNGVEKMVQLDLLDTSVNKLNKNEKKALNSFIESNINGRNLSLKIGGILNNSWFSEIIVINDDGSKTNLAREVKKLISSDIQDREHLNDRVHIRGLFSSIIDDTTIQVYANDKRIKVKIDDIDGMGVESPYYRKYLAKVLSFFEDRTVEVDAEKIDKIYSNGDILKKRNNETISLAKELVASGLAFASNNRYKKVEAIANKNDKGYWVSEPNYENPAKTKKGFFKK